MARVPWNKGKKGVQVAWNKGKICPQFSKPKTEEHKDKIRKTMTGRIYSEERRNAMKGPRKPLSEEHKKKLSITSQKPRGPMSEEHKRKIGEAQSRYWESLSEAEFREQLDKKFKVSGDIPPELDPIKQEQITLKILAALET